MPAKSTPNPNRECLLTINSTPEFLAHVRACAKLLGFKHAEMVREAIRVRLEDDHPILLHTKGSARVGHHMRIEVSASMKAAMLAAAGGEGRLSRWVESAITEWLIAVLAVAQKEARERQNECARATNTLSDLTSLGEIYRARSEILFPQQ